MLDPNTLGTNAKQENLQPKPLDSERENSSMTAQEQPESLAKETVVETPETPTSMAMTKGPDIDLDGDPLAMTRDQAQGVGTISMEKPAQPADVTPEQPVKQETPVQPQVTVEANNMATNMEQPQSLSSNSVSTENIPNSNVQPEKNVNTVANQAPAMPVSPEYKPEEPISQPQEPKKGFFAWLFGGNKKTTVEAPHEQESQIGKGLDNTETQPAKKE